jgi:hypothetical protein
MASTHSEENSGANIDKEMSMPWVLCPSSLFKCKARKCYYAELESGAFLGQLPQLMKSIFRAGVHLLGLFTITVLGKGIVNFLIFFTVM